MTGDNGSGDDVFRVYVRGDSGPLLLLLHGGGYSALTWSLLAVRIAKPMAILLLCSVCVCVVLYIKSSPYK